MYISIESSLQFHQTTARIRIVLYEFPYRDSSTYHHSSRMLERAETNVYDVCSLSRWQKQRPEPGVSQWNISFPSSTKAT